MWDTPSGKQLLASLALAGVVAILIGACHLADKHRVVDRSRSAALSPMGRKIVAAALAWAALVGGWYFIAQPCGPWCSDEDINHILRVAFIPPAVVGLLIVLWRFAMPTGASGRGQQ